MEILIYLDVTSSIMCIHQLCFNTHNLLCFLWVYVNSIIMFLFSAFKYLFLILKGIRYNDRIVQMYVNVFNLISTSVLSVRRRSTECRFKIWFHFKEAMKTWYMFNIDFFNVWLLPTQNLLSLSLSLLQEFIRKNCFSKSCGNIFFIYFFSLKYMVLY